MRPRCCARPGRPRPLLAGPHAKCTAAQRWLWRALGGFGGFVAIRPAHSPAQPGARPLFDLFKSQRFHDPELGELVRSRGLWRGLLTVEAGVSVPLALSGKRTEPDAQALAAAREVPQAFASWRPAIEQALF